MPDERTNDLHLPDLSITGFRGIEHLSIARLGRVTLLTGRNGVGKTTVLDAVRVYAARGRPIVLHELLEQREEFVAVLDEDHNRVVVPDYTALFHGRGATQEDPIRIGPRGGGDDLLIAGLPRGIGRLNNASCSQTIWRRRRTFRPSESFTDRRSACCLPFSP